MPRHLFIRKPFKMKVCRFNPHQGSSSLCLQTSIEGGTFGSLSYVPAPLTLNSMRSDRGKPRHPPALGNIECPLPKQTACAMAFVDTVNGWIKARAHELETGRSTVELMREGAEPSS